MKFTINQNSIKEFKNCIKVTSSIYDMTDRSSKVFIKAEDNTLYTVISLNNNFIKFKNEIQDLRLAENESKFLTFDLKTFSSLLEKAAQVSNDDVIFETQSSKINLKNGKSVYSFQAFNNYDDEEFEDEFNLRTKKFSETFKDTFKIKINQEIIDFIDLTSKAIKLLNKPYLVSGILLEKNKLKFCDQQFFLVEKTMSYDCGEGEKYLPYNLFNVFTSLYGLIGEFEIELTNFDREEGNFISLKTSDANEFDMIFSVPYVNCVFPSQEDLNMILPEDSLKYSFDVNREELLGAISQFEGVFPSAYWSYKPINFMMDKDSSELSLEFNDMNTEVNSSIKIENPSVVINPSIKEDEDDKTFNERKKNYEFLKCAVSVFSLQGFLEKECKSEKIHMSVSPESATFDSHGTSIEVISEEDGCWMALAKMYIKE